MEASGLDFGSSGVNFFEIFAYFWPCVPRTCQALAENLPKHTMPASIDLLLRPADVGLELPRGGGAAVVPPGGFAIKSAASVRMAGV